MRQTLAFLAATMVSLMAVKSTIAAPGAPGVGDRLSLSITNKYGDVLANPTVAQILGDGLILERGTVEVKVKYEDLPASVRQKYQPLAAGVIKKEEKKDAANAAYVAYTRQLQAEQAQHLAAQQQQENEQAQARIQSQPTVKYLAIPIPDQNWKLTILNLGFKDWKKEENHNQFLLHGQTGPGGFNFSLFVENPVNNLPGNEPVYNFFWSNMAHDSLIDAQSVRVEPTDRFIKVSYTAQGQSNVNYFFAYQGKWVDVHLSKGISSPGDGKLFDEFGNALSWGQ